MVGWLEERPTLLTVAENGNSGLAGVAPRRLTMAIGEFYKASTFFLRATTYESSGKPEECPLLRLGEIGGCNERYTFTDPPIPTEDFAGSLYIGKAFNLQADWQNTFELAASNRVVAGSTYYLEKGHDNSFSLHEENNFALDLQDQWENHPESETELRANPFKGWQVRGAFTWTESYFTLRSDDWISGTRDQALLRC